MGVPFGSTDEVGAKNITELEDVNLINLDISGNVGIGANTPGSKLEVNGHITVNNVFASDGYTGSNLHITSNSSNPSATRLKLSEFGEILADGSSQYIGTDGAVLISKGVGNPVEWRPRVIASAYLTNDINATSSDNTDMKPLTLEVDLGSGTGGSENTALGYQSYKSITSGFHNT